MSLMWIEKRMSPEEQSLSLKFLPPPSVEGVCQVQNAQTRLDDPACNDHRLILSG